MIEQMLTYWRTGGALMPVLAFISYGIWFYFLGLRARALQISGSPGRFSDSDLEQLDRDLLILTALTAAAPLLGLLGTVMGMVTTFQAVSGQFGNTSSEVASGISQALITTQCGLVVAIPGLFGRARIERLMKHAHVRIRGSRLLRDLSLAPALEAQA